MTIGLETLRGLRVSEKVVLAFLSYGAIAAALAHFSPQERIGIWALNLVAAGVILLLARFGDTQKSALLASLRNWLPCILIIIAYRESGLFFVPDPSHRLDYLFERWDVALLSSHVVAATLSFLSPWLQWYLELAYFFCYPIVPLGLASIYFTRKDQAQPGAGETHVDEAIDRYWTSVLVALFTCYVLFPLFPATPPRLFFHDLAGPEVRPLFRALNFWILGKYGVPSSMFPSGHVAGVTAVALTVRRERPRAAVLFAIAALSVALATVVGRYHYAVDAVAGALVGAAAYLVTSRLHRR